MVLRHRQSQQKTSTLASPYHRLQRLAAFLRQGKSQINRQARFSDPPLPLLTENIMGPDVASNISFQPVYMIKRLMVHSSWLMNSIAFQERFPLSILACNLFAFSFLLVYL
jgi:fluoride ion exporter CrcB/FEX